MALIVEKETYYGFTSKQFKSILDELGLTASSCHYGFHPYLERSRKRLMRFCRPVYSGCSHIKNPLYNVALDSARTKNLRKF